VLQRSAAAGYGSIGCVNPLFSADTAYLVERRVCRLGSPDGRSGERSSGNPARARNLLGVAELMAQVMKDLTDEP
jgi:hypothetical protein